MRPVLFSSDDMPGRDDRRKFAAWSDLVFAQYGATEITRGVDLPFRAQFAFVPLKTIGIGLMKGPLERIFIGRDNTTDAFALAINVRSMPISYTCRDRTVLIEPGMATLFALGEPGGGCRAPALDNEWFSLAIARKALLDAVCKAESRLAVPIGRDNEPLWHLTRYLALLVRPHTRIADQHLLAHLDQTILDLIALSLGSGGDAEALAAGRGLRAARRREILAQIERGFADADFSVRHVAARLRLSPRYVNELVHETGTTFCERVLELRLQKAHCLLRDPRNDALKIIDLAYTAGFNDVSYFNRCFRRRFGTTPSAARG